MDLIFSQALGPIKFALAEKAAQAEKYILYGGVNPPCRKGCSSCCYQLIHVLIAEAIIIYEYLKTQKQWQAVRERARAQFEFLKDNPHPIVWFKMGKQCPVLDPETKTCMAYSTRPIACAIHFVLSNPKTCDPYYTGGEEYQALDFNNLFNEFRDIVDKNVAGFGILGMELPLPVALLLSERISIQSGVSLEKAVSLILNEL